MAQTLVIGAMATVEMETGKVYGTALAVCETHSPSDGRLAPPGNCTWYWPEVGWEDAHHAAVRHADTGN